MWKYIDRLREKPEAYRRRFAFFMAAGITGVIFLVWVTTLPFTIGAMQKEVAENSENTIEEVSPLDAAKQNFGTAFVGLQNQFQDLTGEFNGAMNTEATGTIEEYPSQDPPSSDFNQSE